MSATGQPSEEELRAAYEAEIKKIRVEQILLEQVVTLINLGMRRTGLPPGTEDERDPARCGSRSRRVRALLPLVEEGVGAEQTGAIREALSQLQMAFVRIGGQDPAAPGDRGGAGSPAGEPASGPPTRGGPGGPASGATGEPGGATGEPGGAAPRPGEEPDADPGQAGPAQRSGRLWVPGQR